MLCMLSSSPAASVRYDRHFIKQGCGAGAVQGAWKNLYRFSSNCKGHGVQLCQWDNLQMFKQNGGIFVHEKLNFLLQGQIAHQTQMWDDGKHKCESIFRPVSRTSGVITCTNCWGEWRRSHRRAVMPQRPLSAAPLCNPTTDFMSAPSLADVQVVNHI